MSNKSETNVGLLVVVCNKSLRLSQTGVNRIYLLLKLCKKTHNNLLNMNIESVTY